MSLQHTYVKQRRQFNRGQPAPPYFLRSEILANYSPVKNERKHFLTKWTMDKSNERRTQFAVASVNTENAEKVSRGMCHVEGGYAKEIDIDDEEQTLRYKKKLQRSEEYRIEMTKNLESMKKAVMQNAGVNIYENYFESCADSANVLHCYRHPNPEVMCPATKVSFAIEQSPKIAVAYSHSVYELHEENVTCPLVWILLSAQNECLELNCESSCSTLAYHKKFSNIISGGLLNGEVCIWDVRSAEEPCIVADIAHKGYVSCLRWSHKNNFEMITGSSAGGVFWWDIRKMDKSLYQYRIASVEESVGGKSDDLGIDGIDSTEFRSYVKNACSALDFDKINSKDIRIGTGDGRVIYVRSNSNKLEKIDEIKGHEDFISTIAQNWASYKCILTIDSCDIKIWTEDMKSDPMFSVSSIENEFSCGAWSLTRYSRFFIGKIDGSIQLWDLTFSHNEPYFTLTPTCDRVNDIQTNNYGNLMACCYNNGDVYAIEVVDHAPGTFRPFKIEELNFGDKESD